MNKVFRNAIFSLFILLIISFDALADVPIFDGGVSGSFASAERDGEGIITQIFELGDGSVIVIAHWFTFDMNGNQMWIAASSSPVTENQTVVTLVAETVTGPMFGDDFDPNDAEHTPWGSLTMYWPTCNDIVLSWASTTGFGNGTMELPRFTSIKQVDCVEPPPEEGIQPGTWTGLGICMNVGDSGNTITALGSQCDDSVAFDAKGVPGLSTRSDACDVSLECEGEWPIIDGVFYCLGENKLVTGIFSEGQVIGQMFDTQLGEDVCKADWVATPE
jgi:hypothetical protein